MKTIFCALFSVVFFFGANAQSDLGLLSAYVDRYAPAEEAPQCLRKFETFIDEQQVIEKVAASIDTKVVSTLDNLFELKDASSFLDKSEYQSLLDNHEAAPAEVEFSVSDVIDYGPEVMRTDYKLTNEQVIVIDNYLAVDDIAPFDNRDVIKKAFSVIKDVKGLAIVSVSFDNRYSVGLLGEGKSTILADVTIRIYNKKGKTIFGKNATGIAETTIQIIKEGEYNIDDLTPVFEEAVYNALAAVETELPRSIKKIKW